MVVRVSAKSLQLRHINPRASKITGNGAVYSNGKSRGTGWFPPQHYNDVIMTTMASQITNLTVVYSTIYSDADQRKHQSSASLTFVWGNHRDWWIPHTKGQLRGKCFHLMTPSGSTVLRKVFPCHDVLSCLNQHSRRWSPRIFLKSELITNYTAATKLLKNGYPRLYNSFYHTVLFFYLHLINRLDGITLGAVSPIYRELEYTIHDDVIKWKHFSALLALCEGNSLVTHEFHLTKASDIFFDLSLDTWLRKSSRRRWLETPSRSLWCHCNALQFAFDWTFLLHADRMFPDSTATMTIT